MIKKFILLSILGLFMASCSTEPTPQELREKAKELETKANTIEAKAKKKATHRTTVREAMNNVNSMSDEIYTVCYIGKHKYLLWYHRTLHKAYLSIVHDPDCEMKDIETIIKKFANK